MKLDSHITGLSFHGTRTEQFARVDIVRGPSVPLLYHHRGLGSCTCFDWGAGAAWTAVCLLADSIIAETVIYQLPPMPAWQLKELVDDFAGMISELDHDGFTMFDWHVADFARAWLNTKGIMGIT